MALWQILLLSTGLLLLVEGTLYALLPRTLQRLMGLVQKLPPTQLRWSGLAAFLLGAFLLWASWA